MPLLRFVNATPIDSLVEVLDLRFSYFLDNQLKPRSIRLIGGPLRHKATLEQQQQAQAYLFAAALYVIEAEWSSKGLLPSEERVYVEKRDFPKQGLEPLNWEGYRLSLPE